MTDPKPLTVSVAVALGRVALAAANDSRVRRLVGSEVVEGTARSIGGTDGSHAGSHDDIRNMHLRVTTRSGFDAFWLIQDLMTELADGTFVIDQ